MASNDYHFISKWRVDGTIEEVADILGDPTTLPSWWSDVYLSVEQLRPPDPDGLGRRARLQTRGRLPYTLTWELEVVESRYPLGFAIVVSGDFEGQGVWTFRQNGPAVDITYDWRIRVEKPLVSRLSFLLKPIFEWNHRWAMARGEVALRNEVARRRARSPRPSPSSMPTES